MLTQTEKSVNTEIDLTTLETAIIKLKAKFLQLESIIIIYFEDLVSGK